MVMAARLGSSMWQSRHRTVHLIGSRASRYWRLLSVEREPISTRPEAFLSFIKWTPLLVLHISGRADRLSIIYLP
jgi:hypothetical protein